MPTPPAPAPTAAAARNTGTATNKTSTKDDQHSHAINGIARTMDRIQALFSRRNFIILSLVYAALYFGLIYIEGRLAQSANSASPIQLIGNKLTYSPSELAYFLAQLGPFGREWYLFYLAAETPFAVSSALLFSYTVGYVANILAGAETRVEDRIEKLHRSAGTSIPARKAKPHLLHLRSMLLLSLPPILSLFEMAENMLMMCLVLDNDAVAESARRKYDSFSGAMAGPAPGSPMDITAMMMFSAASITKYKWYAMRMVVAVTVLTLFSGWTRVIVYWLHSGEAMFEGFEGAKEAKTFYNGLVKQVKGLSKGSDLSAETWKNSDHDNSPSSSTAAAAGTTQGRVNNKKKKRTLKKE
ncbi:hypothetical protein BASA50_008359 [Batrachochytrium salamandrivorans]|uniref:Uncharacterized protein n=1 Tax=Batrachochytrium salamandrivorans TaxID=1357716 RepID=A0ABQ8F7J6_9FUNG|nr:hypothetical protein BASA62_007657 [Batrachochytrium salamandrivorans]KAH6590102.1 hypothetical protein BASA61_005395 [Batrachochytrium salamandrivorans]KAH6591960.1 hypothetical protein BASA50_008359 [Batrachochytrium salamandrivorans]KAH9252403.1 hypothetical protein BASA81_009689 [Batrachochytrium salamandrivorans]KAH9267924.1 hypothetical protein BASA83_009636 [Batrachochytrium salamandrivorans]